MVRGIKGTGKHGCCKVKGTDIGCANDKVTSSQIPRSRSYEGQIQLKVKCQGHFKVKYLKLFIIANYAMTPCCEVFIKVRVISRSNISYFPQ